MKIAIAGGTGTIGSAVTRAAEGAGHKVTVVHIPRPAKSVAHQAGAWQPELQKWQPADFSGYDAVMFFGGESINSRWTEKKKARIRLSRELPCRRIAECAVQAKEPPAVIISASAVGYYGDRGEEIVTEETSAGTGFLAEGAIAWENAWAEAEKTGIRVVKLRFGMVLSRKGGAIKMMLPAFKAGLGGKLGSGRQWMPWISAVDAGRIATWAAEQGSISGAINAVSPEPVRQAEFAKALGQVVKRPAIAPVPTIALQAVFGEMAEQTILTSCKAVPAKASEKGFHFQHDNIVKALLAIM